MRAPESVHRTRPALAAALTAGALLLVGCSARDLPEPRVQAFGATAASAQTLPGAPMAVGCEPNQRAIVRPVIMNGVAVSQVDCVSSGFAPAAAQPGVASPMPVSYGYQDPAPSADATRAVPVSYSAPRVSETRRVVSTRSSRIEPQGRSWKKSALIIGSSAGVGAGVGGAVGGKKGALIGAAIGGGGATIWDQMTRRN